MSNKNTSYVSKTDYLVDDKNASTREQNRKYNKAYWDKMSVEERRAKWRERYHNMSPEAKFNHNKRGREWYWSNVEKSQAAVHQAAIRQKYPNIYKSGNIKGNVKLADWIKENRDKDCPYCGDNSTHIDHINPLSKGGTHTWDNIQMTCKFCNISKNNLSEEEFLTKIAKIYKNREQK